MNSKRANWLFLSTLCLEAVVVIALIFCSDFIKLGIVGSILSSQAVVFVPTILFLILTKTNPFSLIQHKRIKLSTVFLVVVFTYLCMPLIIVVNLISQLFVENAVNDMMNQLLGIPPLLAVLLVGVLGPLNEEFVFRGVIYHSYRRDGSIIGGAVLSAVLFGMTHLNFNQMSYAILVGIVGVLLIECTGNIVSSMIFHIVINTTNMIPVVLFPERLGSSGDSLKKQIENMNISYKEYLCMGIAVYAIIAAITTALAVCILYVIAQREGKAEFINRLLHKGKVKNKNKIISIPLIIAMVYCLVVMIVDVVYF